MEVAREGKEDYGLDIYGKLPGYFVVSSTL